MNIYHVERKREGGYDTYSDFVCIAPDEAAAARTHPREGYRYDEANKGFTSDPEWNSEDLLRNYPWIDNLDELTVTQVGTALPGLEPRVICSSFHAG